MQGRMGLDRFARIALLTLAALALMGALAAASAQADGTIVVKKGGDRTSSSATDDYAAGVSGATFEYTTSESKAADPDSTGWTAFPNATGANGEATVTVPADTYYVREKGAGTGGFGNYGAVHSLHFNPDGGTAPDAQPYVAKVEVENGETTNAYPHDDYDSDDPGDTDDWEPFNGPGFFDDNDLSPFINVRDNAAFPQGCGTNILLVLDRSGSIGGHEDDYRDAAQAFVNSLDGTPTQIGIISFAENVSSYGSGDTSETHSPLDLDTPGSAATLNDTIDDVYDDVDGSTNWDGALQAAAAAKAFTANGSTGQTTNPDVVVFITDGNPTINETDDNGDGSDVDLLNLTAGMASANLVKDQPARQGTKLKMFAIGVGSGVTAENLKVVSGPTEGVDGDYATPSIPELQSFLAELASTTCGARINVRKHLADDSTHANQANWSYTGARGDGGTIAYIDGNQKTHSTGNPPSVETGVLAPNVPAAGTSLTVTEDPYSVQPQSGYSQLDSIQCATGGYGGTPITGSPSGRGISFNVTRGEQIFCTYTNSKPKANIKVVKHLAPASDGGRFDLEVDSDTVATAVGNNGSGDKDVTPGTYTVSEAGANGTDLGKYASTYACTINGQSGPSGSGTSVDVTPAGDDDVVCTFTNTRKAKITVVKDLEPASDPGLFDLEVGGQTVKSDATDGGQGSRLVDPGTYSVSEAAGTGTDLSDYNSSIACTNNASGQGTSLDVAVAAGDDVTCTITNTRKAKITVVKDLEPAGDPGLFDLEVDGTVVKSDATDGGRGSRLVDPGTHSVSEAAGTGTDLSKYSSTISCTNQTSGEGTSLDVAVAAGDDVTCTITNTRDKANIKVVKDLVPDTDIGRFNLLVGTGVVASNVGDGGNGNEDVAPGSYDVSETAGTGTNLGDYDSSISCQVNGANPTSGGHVTVDSNDNAVCTITNTRKPPHVTLSKTTSTPTISAGDIAKFQIKVSNDGTGSAKGVVVSDTLPGPVAGHWQADGTLPTGCSIDTTGTSDELNCAIQTLDAGATLTINLKATAPAQQCADLDNTVSATVGNGADPDDASALVHCNNADVSLSKTTSTGTISAGDVAKFQIELVNNGAGEATGVTVSDVLPNPVAGSGWQFDGLTPIGCSIADGSGPNAGHQVLSCSGLTLAPQGQPKDSLTINLKATTPAKQCADLDNTVSATVGNGADPDDASATVHCNNPAVKLSKTTSTGTISAGDVAKFQIEVSNDGTGTAKNVKVSDTLPGPVDGHWTGDPNNGSLPAGCSIDISGTSDVLSCTFATLAGNSSKTIDLEATTPAQQCANLDNTVSATVGNGADPDDASATVHCNNPSLSVRKSGNGPIDAGDPAVFSITLFNNGPGVAGNATLNDPLPAGLDWSITTQPNGSPCSITGAVGSQTLSCNFGDLGPQGSRLVEVRAQTSFEQCASYENTATGDADNAAPTTDDATIDCNKPDLKVDKKAASGTVSAGDPLKFSITVSNDGPGEAKGVTLSDPLPLGTAGGWTIDSAPAGWGCTIAPSSPTSDQQTLSCASIGVIDTGESGTVVVTAATSAQACTTYDNTATASATNSPGRSDDAAIECNKPGLAVLKTAVQSTINAGDDAQFSIEVSNTGPGVAHDVDLNDPLPGGTAGPWTITDQPAGSPCSITGTTLSCSFGNLAPQGQQGDSVTVKVSAPTDPDHCTTYDNTATATASNAGDATDSATIDCQRATITVRKVLEPAGDDGRFDLRVDGDTVKQDAGNGDSGSEHVAPGTHTVSEIAGNSSSDLSNYGTSIACTNDAKGQGTSLAVNVKGGDDVTCTITNTRKAKITVVKQLVPKTDPGRFDLRVGDDTVKPGAGDGDHGSTLVDPGTYDVSEAGAAGTDLSKYGSSISCSNEQTGKGRSLDVRVRAGDDVTCTITNTRRKGNLTVVKRLVPKTDPGRFDLRVDNAVVKAAAGDGGKGSTAVDPGSYKVSETAAAGTSLSSYSSAIKCTVNGKPGPKGAGTSLAGVKVDSNDNVVCTIVNVRRGAAITVVKRLSPASDAGRFDLEVDGAVVKAGAGNGGTGSKGVAPGVHTVSESGASLSKYSSAIKCTVNGRPGPQRAGTSLPVRVDSNDNVVCTIVNVRRGASITVVKRLSPASDAGRFDLEVDGAVVKAGAGNGGTGSKGVAPGVHTVSESGASLGDYSSAIACTVNGGPGESGNGTSLRVRVDSNDRVVCTITNTRKPPPPSTGQITVVKQLKPSNDRGRFDLEVDGNVVKKAARDGGSGTATVTAGDHRVSESGARGSKLGRYSKSVTCELDGKRIAQGKGGHLSGVHVGAGDHVTCTIRNKRHRKITHGRARLHGPSPHRCVRKGFRVRVTGRHIAAVRFFLNGKRIKTVHARRHHSLAVRIRAGRLRAHGNNRVVAKVTFKKGTRPRHRTLKLRVHRCEPKPPPAPHFTG